MRQSGKFQTCNIFPFFVHVWIQNTVKTAKNAGKHKNMSKLATKVVQFCKGCTLGFLT